MPSDAKFDAALDGFRRSVDAARVGHAYLVIAPPRGDGLRFAELALGLLFCTGASKPCGNCHSCRALRDHTHSDVVWVEPVKKSQKIGVDEIRAVLARMSQTSFEGSWKAVVLLYADRLGEEAANTFLKTLEEPMGPSLFLLLTDRPSAVLPTVFSRCQRITLAGEQAGLAEEWARPLRELLMADERGPLAELWRSRKLIRLLDAIRARVKEEETELAREEARKSEIATGRKRKLDEREEDRLDARIASRYKETRTAVLRDVLRWHADLLLLVSGAGEDAIGGRETPVREDGGHRCRRRSGRCGDGAKVGSFSAGVCSMQQGRRPRNPAGA